MTGEKHHRKLLEGEGHVGSGAYKHLEKVGTEVRLCAEVRQSWRGSG